MTGSTILLETSAAVPDGDEPLAPLDLSLSAGETLFLLGPDRQQLLYYLRMLAGVDAPLAGGVERRFEESFAGERLAFVDCAIPLLSILSGRDNLRLPMHYHGQRERAVVDARVDALLGAIDYPADHDALPAYMPLLQQRHLLLARALMVRPELLLVADPFTGLSADERLMIVEFLKQQNGQGVTLVVSTDQAELAYRYSDAIVFVGGGHCYCFHDWQAMVECQAPDVVAYVSHQLQCAKLFMGEG